MSFVVGEMHMFQLYRFVESLYLLGFSHFLDIVLSMKNLVDALHGSKTFLNAVTCFGEVFDRLQCGVEHDQIEDEVARLNGRVALKNKITSKPQHDDNHASAEKFAHGVGCRLSDSHFHGCIAVFVVDFRETLLHLAFSDECLDDAKPSQCLFYLTDAVAPFGLGIERT